MIKITQQNEQMFYWHVHCCKQHLARKSLPKSFDCYKLGGFPKTTENCSLLIFMDQSKKLLFLGFAMKSY